MMSMYKTMISDASFRAKEELLRRRHYFSIDPNTTTTNRGIPLRLRAGNRIEDTESKFEAYDRNARRLGLRPSARLHTYSRHDMLRV